METIKNYIENLFSALPVNAETKKAKEEFLTNMEDKYTELKNQGKSENEAIGIVIAEFGNIDELKRELGLDSVLVADPNLRIITKDEANKFLEIKKDSGKIIALGVVLCILGVAALIFISGILANITEYDGVFGVVALLLFVAGGVALFIPSGIKLSKYEYMKSNIIMSSELKAEIEENRENYLSKFITSIVIGVMLCILSVVPIIIFGVFGRYEYLGVVIFFIFISISVFLFINAGTVYSAYDMLLQRGDYKPKNKKSEKIVSAVASVVWPLTVIAFLIWGFGFHGWHISWILFPIVGIIFGAFSALMSAIMDDK